MGRAQGFAGDRLTGENVPSPIPNWEGVSQDFGTDGRLHNFLRYLENWVGKTL